MAIWDFLFNNKESHDGTVVGTIECDRNNAVQVITGLASTMGMANVGMASHSGKGISISQKDSNTYEIIMYNYNPPLVISWSNTIPVSQLAYVIDQLSQGDQSIAAINNISRDNGAFIQVGLV